ncbi:MAG: hypothetical protein PWP31_1664 [Clostridia bacterium]|nr:hypothetical protein [Clostridia bacterium]
MLYTPAFAKSTKTNDNGIEILLKDVDLPLKAGKTYECTVEAKIINKGDNPIPRNGFVISGHGKARDFLSQIKEGDKVKFTCKFTDKRWNKVVEAIGGRDIIIQNGKIAIPKESKDMLVSKRHPRTALGATKDGRLEIVVADGRQQGYSEGMNLYELAEFMLNRGIVAAINLDGVGSSVLAARKVGENFVSVLNRPSDGFERAVTNGLAVFSTAPQGKLSHLYLFPKKIKVYKVSKVQFILKAQDDYYNPIELPSNVTWRASRRLGKFISPGLFRADRVGEGKITARIRNLRATSEIKVVDEVSKIKITPDIAFLEPGSTKQFAVKAFDENNEEIYVDKELYEWSISPEFGQSKLEKGQLTVNGKVTNGKITVKLGDSETVAKINPTVELQVQGKIKAGKELKLIACDSEGLPLKGAIITWVNSGESIGKVTVTASALYLRKGPGTEYKVKDLLPNGLKLTVLSREENNWLHVLLPEGREGYVSGEYVSVQTGNDILGKTNDQGELCFIPRTVGSYEFKAQKDGYIDGTLMLYI